jgi:hypothetical protein
VENFLFGVEMLIVYTSNRRWKRFDRVFFGEEEETEIMELREEIVI